MLKCTYTQFHVVLDGVGEVKGIKKQESALGKRERGGREKERKEVMFSHLVQGGVLVKCNVSFWYWRERGCWEEIRSVWRKCKPFTGRGVSHVIYYVT